ncbi:hypothetical protein RchiOBHm_Chr6g0255941 [Rosa chinensis]|uniref:RPN1 N-terminal domain-containing protein n=1 Tax=Rosa chinensis TaxID=74649 RepID=A0A2P6PM13_ROSCH|nr:hypothetical protein RchiOBHm_Chr6g0255941 [Rosa chinensis]
MSAEGERESLKFRLLGSDGDIGSWGHEHLQSDETPFDDLMELVQQIVAFHIRVRSTTRLCVCVFFFLILFFIFFLFILVLIMYL